MAERRDHEPSNNGAPLSVKGFVVKHPNGQPYLKSFNTSEASTIDDFFRHLADLAHEQHDGSKNQWAWKRYLSNGYIIARAELFLA